MKLKVM